MDIINTISTPCDFNLYHMGWKYYNSIKKKAMEQEFSWSGLVLSLSIAFFIVVSSALVLSSIYRSLTFEQNLHKTRDNGLYRIESVNKSAEFLNIELLTDRQFKNTNKINLA